MKENDLALKIGVVLMLPYILWLAKFTDDYIPVSRGATRVKL